MAPGEELFFWAAVGLYVFSCVMYFYGLQFSKEKWTTRATIMVVAGFAAHTAALIARWIATGHPPVMRSYENGVAGAWCIMLGYLVFALKNRKAAMIGFTTVPISLLLMGYAIMNFTPMEPFSPPHKNVWLSVHVVFAWFAHMAYVISFGLGVAYLLKDRKNPPPYAEKLPSLKALDEMTYRYVAFGFIMDTVMIVSGSIWASSLWGSYWSWDPIETWSLISWLLYAIYLHLRATMKWKGRRAAWLAVIALSGVIISFWGVNYVQSSMHVLNTL